MSELETVLAKAKDWNSRRGQISGSLASERNYDAEGAQLLRKLISVFDAAAVIDRISDERLRAIHREEQFGLFCDYEEFVSIARHLEALLTRAVPEEGLRDSVLNSAKFRASCYALVGIVEGIEGLGRNWAANGERLKDTPEWVAFYNCVASMRNGTFNQASAEQAQQTATAVPEVNYFDAQRIADEYKLPFNAFCAAHRAMLAAALADRKGETP